MGLPRRMATVLIFEGLDTLLLFFGGPQGRFFPPGFGIYPHQGHQGAPTKWCCSGLAAGLTTTNSIRYAQLPSGCAVPNRGDDTFQFCCRGDHSNGGGSGDQEVCLPYQGHLRAPMSVRVLGLAVHMHAWTQFCHWPCVWADCSCEFDNVLLTSMEWTCPHDALQSCSHGPQGPGMCIICVHCVSVYMHTCFHPACEHPASSRGYCGCEAFPCECVAGLLLCVSCQDSHTLSVHVGCYRCLGTGVVGSCVWLLPPAGATRTVATSQRKHEPKLSLCLCLCLHAPQGIPCVFMLCRWEVHVSSCGAGNSDRLHSLAARWLLWQPGVRTLPSRAASLCVPVCVTSISHSGGSDAGLGTPVPDHMLRGDHLTSRPHSLAAGWLLWQPGVRTLPSVFWMCFHVCLHAHVCISPQGAPTYPPLACYLAQAKVGCVLLAAGRMIVPHVARRVCLQVSADSSPLGAPNCPPPAIGWTQARVGCVLPAAGRLRVFLAAPSRAILELVGRSWFGSACACVPFPAGGPSYPLCQVAWRRPR